MDRLTQKDENGINFVNYVSCGNCKYLHDEECDCEQVILDRLANYEDLIEQGLMIELPCKVGDKLWCINDYMKIEEVECLGFIISNNCINVIYRESLAEEDYNVPIGSLIFLTREQAEEKLKESKDGSKL